MLSKEEIRNKWVYHTPLKLLPECVDAAMDEYAQQTAIEFDEWKREEGYKLSFRNQEKWYIPNEGTDVFKYFSNEELYQLFINSKTK